MLSSTTRRHAQEQAVSTFISRRPIRPKFNNSVMRFKTPHHYGFTNKELSENARGIIKGKLQPTLAQIPSIYYYLSQRCGIGYKEAENLVNTKRLLFGGSNESTAISDFELVSDLGQLKMQLPYEAVEDLGLKVLLPGTQQLVPVEKRQYHRQYFATYIPRPLKFTNDPTEPRSFIYTIPDDLTSSLAAGGTVDKTVQQQNESDEENHSNEKNNNNKNDKNNKNAKSSNSSSTVSSSASSGCVNYNILLPPGCVDAYCYGFGIITNDLAMFPSFQRQSEGNFGIYRIWFEPGVPQAEVDEIARILNDMLEGERAQTWAVLDEDAQKNVPQFALATEGAFFSNRLRKAKLSLMKGSPSKREVRKSIWLCTPYLHKKWIKELLLMGVRTTAIEAVQMGHEFRFLHPEIDEFLSLSASQKQQYLNHLQQKSDQKEETKNQILKAFDVEEKSWNQLDAKLAEWRRKRNFLKKKNSKKNITIDDEESNNDNDMLHVFSPGRRSVDWLGQFDPDKKSNDAWFEPLSENAIDTLHEAERRFKVNNVVRSLRDASCF